MLQADDRADSASGRGPTSPQNLDRATDEENLSCMGIG